jgi:transposase
MLKAEAVPPIPALTAEVAQAAFPKGNRYMRLRDTFGEIFQDDSFQALYPAKGQPAYSPWRLALICVMQYMENLTDRQAADAVRARLDWKYVLSLELKDPGFDFSVLTAFRQRLLEHEAGEMLFERLLDLFNEKGFLKSRGKQRTDSTYIVGSLRRLNRLELIGETLRHTLNELASVHPDWLRPLIEEDWIDHYGQRVDEYHLPRPQEARQTLAEQIGADGRKLLEAAKASAGAVDLATSAALQSLANIWQQEFHWDGQQLRWRADNERLASMHLIQSPYEQEARYAFKRQTHWVGYKVHLTETCDEIEPNLIVNVKTSPATSPDQNTLPSIHQCLEQRQLLPAQQFVDAGYTDLNSVLGLLKNYQVKVIGPLTLSGWQARSEGAYPNSAFHFDWEKRETTCPQGKTTRHRKTTMEDGHQRLIVRFHKADCDPCPVRALCTRAKSEPRNVSTHIEHEPIKLLRQEQETEAWQTLYQQRAGIEGTISQTLRVTGLRKARYSGMSKSHLQNLLSAAAVNLIRVDGWLSGVERISERLTPFQKLWDACA